MQVKQEAVAAAKAQQQLQHQQVAAAADHMGTLTSTMLSSDPHYLPGVPEVGWQQQPNCQESFVCGLACTAATAAIILQHHLCTVPQVAPSMLQPEPGDVHHHSVCTMYIIST
jgi:hypothetical protein